MSRSENWVLTTDESGHTRRFGAEDLPVSVGGGADDDIRLAGVAGSLQIGLLDGVFFALPARGTDNVRINGERLRGSAKLGGGDVVALDSARLTCRIAGGHLTLAIEAEVTAGDTAPPDLDELAQRADDAGEVAIQPIAFRPAGAAGARRRRPSAATLAVAAALTVLAVLGWFAFTAKSVSFRVDPQPQTLSLPDTFFKFELGGRYMLRRGTHRVHAELAGYYPLDTEVSVGRSADQTFELTMTKLPGLVTLRTEPAAPADVTLDGESLGTTPLADVEVRPGVHRFEFKAERFLPEVRELDVAGGHERQSLTAMLTPSWAPVGVTSTPAGAQVLVDGEPAATTPAELELEAGRREIELRLPGHNAWRDTILVNADEPLTLPSVELEPADGRVELVSEPADAAVSLNGEFAGRTPLTLSLRPGRTHALVVSKPGYAPATRELSVEADSGRRLALELEGEYGEVAVTSVPEGAEILVDGEPAGTTPSRLRLMAVEHEIAVRLEGYAARADTRTPRPGYTQTLEFELERLDDETGGGYPRTITTALDHELRLVPAGAFTMGSSRRDPDRRSNETLKPVRISEAFYIGVREVTNAEFRAFVPEHDSGEFGGMSLNGDDQPVVSVSWAEVAQYLNALSIDEGLQPVYVEDNGEWLPARPLRNGYRLPTEAEWAYAARALGQDEPLKYPWGAELPAPDRSGNYADIAAVEILPTTLGIYNDGYAVTAPPGSFDANAAGLADIGGNVAEWVQDYYGIEVEPSATEAVDPLGPESGSFHVVRGSSWRSATARNLRLAYRDYSGEQRNDLGFRIARNLD